MQLAIDEAICVTFPVIIKSGEDAFGRRMVSVEASSEKCDLEGDVIEQKALLDSAEFFIKNGHIDWNHFSEIGTRLGIPGAPSDWIIGNPREVLDLGSGRTGVNFEIRRSFDGSFEPTTKIYDAIWRDLTITTPPINYRASIYGFPKDGMIEDCRKATCDSAATRYHIKGMDWKSLALTTNPINDFLTGFATVITAKSLITLIKGDPGSFAMPPSWAGSPRIAATGNANENPAKAPVATAAEPGTGIPLSPAPSFPVPPPRNLSDAVGQYHHHMAKCPMTAGLKSTAGFKSHFIACCGMDESQADLYGHALMHALLLGGRRI